MGRHHGDIAVTDAVGEVQDRHGNRTSTTGTGRGPRHPDVLRGPDQAAAYVPAVYASLG